MPTRNAEQMTESALAALLTLAVAFFTYRLLLKGLQGIVRATNLPPVTERRLQRVLRWIVFGIAFLMLLQHAGILRNAWALVSAMLAAAAVAFVAVWSVLSNVVCAVMILIYRPFRIGDRIEIIEPAGGTGLSGHVADMNLIFTTILQTDADNPEDPGVEVRVPNNIFFQKFVRRWPGSGGTRRDTFFESNAGARR